MGQNEWATLGPDVQPFSLKARSLESIAEYINSGRAKKIVVLTGAGISTAAGIPDFRSPGTGLYDNLKRLNLPYPEAVFDINFFRKHPEPFYVLAKELYPGKFYPTISHTFISLLAKKKLLTKLFTQNIDCLERRAGVPAGLIIEAHGSFVTQRCIDCKSDYPEEDMKIHVDAALVPKCRRKKCGGLVKPDIVFFGEGLPWEFTCSTHLAREADLVLILGTSLTVYPFAGVADMPKRETPRVLFNREQVGSLGNRPDDVLELGTCDQGVRKLAKLLGWTRELDILWRKTVGNKEAERQLATQDTYEDEIEDFDDKIVDKMAEGLEGLDLKDEEDKDGKVKTSVEAKTDSQEFLSYKKLDPESMDKTDGEIKKENDKEENSGKPTRSESKEKEKKDALPSKYKQESL